MPSLWIVSGNDPRIILDRIPDVLHKLSTASRGMARARVRYVSPDMSQPRPRRGVGPTRMTKKGPPAVIRPPATPLSYDCK